MNWYSRFTNSPKRRSKSAFQHCVYRLFSVGFTMFSIELLFVCTKTSNSFGCPVARWLLAIHLFLYLLKTIDFQLKMCGMTNEYIYAIRSLLAIKCVFAFETNLRSWVIRTQFLLRFSVCQLADVDISNGRTHRIRSEIPTIEIQFFIISGEGNDIFSKQTKRK